MNSSQNISYGISLLRVTNGALLMVHGLVKLLINTPAGTAGYFESIGLPGFSAYLVMLGELGLGLALILGLKTRLAAALAAPILLGSIMPHAPNGFIFSSPGGGWEYSFFWSMALIAQALMGGGAFAIDQKKIS